MKDRLKIIEAYSDSDEELEQVEVDERIRKKWDCESILSTHSNLYNHPKLLEEPKLKVFLFFNQNLYSINHPRNIFI